MRVSHLGLVTVALLICLFVEWTGTRAEAGPPPPANELFGFISMDRTLTFAPPGPAYFVLGDVVVNPGVTLTIEPGVTLIFSANSDTLGGG